MNKFGWMVGALALFLTACATGKFPETSTPKLDENFGKSINAAKEAQKINPAPSQTESATSAKETTQSYDNFIKGKPSTAPLQAPISNGGM
jgi:hypothetical protein